MNLNLYTGKDIVVSEIGRLMLDVENKKTKRPKDKKSLKREEGRVSRSMMTSNILWFLFVFLSLPQSLTVLFICLQSLSKPQNIADLYIFLSAICCALLRMPQMKPKAN